MFIQRGALRARPGGSMGLYPGPFARRGGENGIMLKQGSPFACLGAVGRGAAPQLVAAVAVAVQGGPAKAGHRFRATIPSRKKDVFHAASLRSAVGQGLSELAKTFLTMAQAARNTPAFVFAHSPHRGRTNG